MYVENYTNHGNPKQIKLWAIMRKETLAKSI
jgi:hypothetical protein